MEVFVRNAEFDLEVVLAQIVLAILAIVSAVEGMIRSNQLFGLLAIAAICFCAILDDGTDTIGAPNQGWRLTP